MVIKIQGKQVSIYQNKKTEKWEIAFDNGRKDNGKRDRVVLRGESKAEVKRKCQDFFNDMDKKEEEIYSYMNFSFEEISEKYLLSYKKDIVSDSTYLNYITVLKIAYREFGNNDIKDISKETAQDFLVKLKKERYGYQTVLRLKMLLTSIAEYSLKNGYIEKNFMEDVQIPVIRDIKKKKAIDEDILKIIEDKFYSSNIKNKEFFILLNHLLLNTGMRIGEALALRLEDFDYDRNIITINESLTIENEYDENNSYIHKKQIIDKTKTEAGTREIYIDELIANEIKEYIDFSNTTNEEIRKYREKHKEEALLFCSEHGELNPYSRVKGRYDLILKELGLEKYNITFHRYRHTYCTMLAENGASPKVAQTLLGHEDISTTLKIYTSVSSSMKIDACKAVRQNIENLLRRQ